MMTSNKSKFLIVVDMQNDFVYGSLGTPEARAIIPNIYNKIREAKKNGVTIIFTRDTHFENYADTLEGHYLPVEHCVKDTDGWQIISDLPTNQAKIMDKITFGDIWLADDLALYYDLENSPESYIELCGVCTDVCVISNALMLRAHAPNTIIKVDSSCCAGTTPKKHSAALEVMKSCQIEVTD